MEQSTLECPICSNIIDFDRNNVKTECGHSFCLKCLLTSLKTSPNCPICRQEIFKYNDVNKLDTNNIIEIANRILENSLDDIYNLKKLIHQSIIKTITSSCDCVNTICNQAMNLKEEEIDYLKKKTDDIFSKKIFNVYYTHIIKPYLKNISYKATQLTEEYIFKQK